MTWVTSVRTVSNHRGFRPPLAVERVQENPASSPNEGTGATPTPSQLRDTINQDLARQSSRCLLGSSEVSAWQRVGCLIVGASFKSGDMRLIATPY